MRIAVVGWGSLLWSPRTLPLAGTWASDGPVLPIEFARISADGRLTLIIEEGSEPIVTYHALLSVSGLEEAVEALARREVCGPEHIGIWSPVKSRASVALSVLPVLASWARERDLEGVVWTDLPATFADRAGQPWTPPAAVEYLGGLTGPTRQRAEEYVRRAPPQTRTATRTLIERCLGWTPENGD